MENPVVRRVTCFGCGECLECRQYEPYNHSPYISVTLVNGSDRRKIAVCCRCFTATNHEFTDIGWTRFITPEACNA